MGTNMGLWKMAEVSGLSDQAIVNTARNYLRLETLHAANDAISNAIAALPMFHHSNCSNLLIEESHPERVAARDRLDPPGVGKTDTLD